MLTERTPIVEIEDGCEASSNSSNFTFLNRPQPKSCKRIGIYSNSKLNKM